MSVLTLGREREKDGRHERERFKYPGVRAAMDGNTAVIACERESSDAAGAYPITPSTQMGEYWAEAAASGHINISGRPLIFIEPEGEHAAAAVTAGMAMTGLRAANFSSGQGIAYMHESLYAAVGKRLTYVLNIGARAMTKATLNVHAGHDDYHCIDDTGFFQLFAKNAQSAADLNLIAHRLAELSLTPGAIAQDGFLTTHLIESMLVPERELIVEYLGRPDDMIDAPTPAQRIIYGDKRRRIPLLWDVDNPVMAGLVQNQDSYMQSVAAQRPFFFDHVRELADRAFDEFYRLTGRRYARVLGYRVDDAEYLLVGQGSLIPSAEAVVDYLRETRRLKVGVVDLVMFRPFPADLVGRLLRGKKGVAVLERLDQPLAVDLPLVREIRAALSRCLENGRRPAQPFYPDLPTYRDVTDAPPLFSGSFGLGSRDLQPEGIVGAVENMLPDGAGRRFFYLSIDFLREHPITPKQEIYQQTIESSYPQVKQLAVRGSENPNLMPPGSITVRFHSVGGWGAITTGKNLAMTLFDLLGYHIKANPKYGSEKKGQPTTYYLAAAPEPIRVNCEYFYVDVVLSPDPNVFHHTNALAGLKQGGVFVLQSSQPTAEAVWQSIPPAFQRIIIDKNIRVFYLDAFRIAREEASDPDLQLRMQGIAFQGAFFAASPLKQQASLDDAQLLRAIREQLEHKFGSKGARVVEDNMRVVKRGFDEVQPVPVGAVSEPSATGRTAGSEPPIPEMVKRLPASEAPMSDIHRFWEQTGNFYARGMGNDNLTDPFIGLGVMPACTALFRDMTQIRFEHPAWNAEACTACGKCYTVCPDTAIPGLVNTVDQVFDTAISRLRKRGTQLQQLPRAARLAEQALRRSLNEAQPTDSVAEMMEQALQQVAGRDGLSADERKRLVAEIDLLRDELDGFQFALSRPYYSIPEQQQPGKGALLSITVNPYTCKGCMECVEVCDDDALRPVTQSDDSVARLRAHWDFWLDLPNTPREYIRVDDIDQGIGALETILLDKRNYLAFTSGEGACVGCGEKTVIHLFVATVEALMQPRVERHLARLDELIGKLERHVRLELVSEISVGDRMGKIVDDYADRDLTLAEIASRMERDGDGKPIDQEWLTRVTDLVSRLRELRWRYVEGTSGGGRSRMGMINATGCTSVWGSTYPFNPYPFPWANHLFQDSASMAMGVFEGHMVKMADGFKAIRMAELELDGKYDPTQHDEFFTYFNWQQFTDDEWDLCPPVVAVGGDGAMYDIGFQNLSRAMASGKPIKLLVLDTQVYSNTGGQACTSGFVGQISDMAQFGKVIQGKQEPRKEIALIGIAHRTTYVLQSTIAHPGHMIEGFIRGLRARRPALFNLYASCQPEHGIGDDMSAEQNRLAVESRAYPLFRYDPDAGKTVEECLDLDGNPALDQDWPTYTMRYRDGGREREMTVPMTFADFAVTEVRFRKHFRHAPPDTWNDSMVPLAEFLGLTADEREGRFPYLWSVDRNHRLTRLLVDRTLVASCEERRDFWTMLRALAGVGRVEIPREEIEADVRRELVGQIASGLLRLAGGSAEPADVASAVAAVAAGPAPAAGTTGDYLAPWIDSAECTSCDECIKLNGKIFAYDGQKKAFIKDPQGGPYRDLVKAAERCTARVIHPGLPRDRSAKEIDKWIARAEKYN
ncbi:MAG TPA: 2-oxoacid:acceptor oxidoreductase family protein [Candidatus Polarisedimenticolaceae bacterium]|nr:2-oxoacid:acceptor oxidoreductase family protein [Candidatus Polarisedimenticolaceae bacterium]